MNSETLNSLLRTVFALLGAFVAGKGLKFFGVELDGAYWQEITGTAITLATLIWGIASKTVDEEKGEAAIKTVLTFVLAIFATNKLLNSDQVVAILTAVGALLPFLWSYFSKKKTEGIVKGKISVSQLVKTTKMLVVLVMLGICVNAQYSVFNKVHIEPPAKFKQALKSLNVAALAALPKDTTVGMLRPITGIALSFPNMQAMGIAGLGWQNITVTYATADKPETKYVNWSANVIYGLGATATPSIKETSASSFGGLIGALNNSILAGVVFNKGKKNPADPNEKERYLPQVIISYGINLN